MFDRSKKNVVVNSLAFVALLIGSGCDDSTTDQESLALEIDEGPQNVTADVIGEPTFDHSEPGSEPLEPEDDLDFTPAGDHGATTIIDLPGDHTIWFHIDESGVSMTEFSSNGMNWTSSPTFFDATAAEIFWALSEPGAEVPEGLLRLQSNLAAKGEVPSWDEVTAFKPQGWAQQDIAPYAALAVECDSWTTNHCLYTSGVCYADQNTLSAWRNNDEVDRYYGAVCVDSGTVTDVLKYKKIQPAAACAHDSSWTTVWSANFSAGDIATHTYNGFNDPLPPYGLREYDHSLSNGVFDTWNWSSRYRQSNCVL